MIPKFIPGQDVFLLVRDGSEVAIHKEKVNYIVLDEKEWGYYDDTGERFEVTQMYSNFSEVMEALNG